MAMDIQMLQCELNGLYTQCMKNDMFNPQLIDIPFDILGKSNVVFLDVDFIPVVDLMDEELGVIALDDPVRTFPCEEAYLKGIELTREQFMQRFPQVAHRFLDHCSNERLAA